MKDIRYWYEFDRSPKGDLIVYDRTKYAGRMSPSERRGYRLFEGKEYTIAVLSNDSTEDTRKLLYAYVAARKKGDVKKCSLLD